MQRAQKRDAVGTQKFFFRKDVYPSAGSASTSIGSSSGSCSPVEGVPRKKDRTMRNCFPSVPAPDQGHVRRGPVEDEYEEMTIEEIMTGKVRKPTVSEGLVI